ncbi:coiled-coil domain-containing protein lost boys [Musca autumnalis]|uniref:coiled-coil domain-containing protein lost boys n=1 Tax=Musca autumnalis TaxID=221902 RepID=UPI003CF60329
MQRKRDYTSKAKIKIDPHKHDEQLREIEERHEEIEDAVVADEEFQEAEECSDKQIDAGYSEVNMDIGRIDISFSEAGFDDYNDQHCYPPSYYTLSPKERLLLLYAENFRHQFFITNLNPRPLVLALPNECNVQKFVCTTMRPSPFLYKPLRSAAGIASFVADFIIYEPFDDIILFPNRLISPATLLKIRRGNSFEMAVLLCSMLIGAGFNAYVVSGIARTEVVENDQRMVPFPGDIYNFEGDELKQDKPFNENQFSLGGMPDLESHLEKNIAEIVKQNENEKQRQEALKREQEELKQRDADRFRYRKPHAWVVIFRSSTKNDIREKYDEDNPMEDIQVEFIEPSTGFFLSGSCMDYAVADSVWNHNQYYVNKQIYVRVGEIRWDLQNSDDWERLLPGENLMKTATDNVSDVTNEKHLNTIPSWVSKLHIDEKEFEERFPHLQKTVFYKRVKHQRFSPYFNKDGKIMQLTLFTDNTYTETILDCVYFENRADMLLHVEKNYKLSSIKEIFGNGRRDNLLKIVTSMDKSKPKELYFSPNVRRDSMEYLRVESDRIIIKSKDRRDLCYYQEFQFKPGGDVLKKIIQKFKRNYSLPAGRDIAERTFLLMQQRIHLKFHYSPGALTASTCEITKPPKPDYGKEVIYDKSMAKTFKANSEEPELLQLEMYRLVMNQLQNEESAKKNFKKISEEICAIFDNRRNEMETPVLQFRLFDSMRNCAARSNHLKMSVEDNNGDNNVSCP